MPGHDYYFYAVIILLNAAHRMYHLLRLTRMDAAAYENRIARGHDEFVIQRFDILRRQAGDVDAVVFDISRQQDVFALNAEHTDTLFVFMLSHRKKINI